MNPENKSPSQFAKLDVGADGEILLNGKKLLPKKGIKPFKITDHGRDPQAPSKITPEKSLKKRKNLGGSDMKFVPGSFYNEAQRDTQKYNIDNKNTD